MKKIIITIIAFLCTTQIAFGASLIDSYPASNYTGIYVQSADLYKNLGQSFLNPTQIKLDSVTLYLSKYQNATGTMYVNIYAHTGTFGSTGLPTGSVLATSDPLDVSQLVNSSTTLTTFRFSGSNRIMLATSTPYFITFTSNTASFFTLSAFIGVGRGPNSAAGNSARTTTGTTWTYADTSTIDFIYYIYGDDSFSENLISSKTTQIKAKKACFGSNCLNTTLTYSMQPSCLTVGVGGTYTPSFSATQSGWTGTIIYDIYKGFFNYISQTTGSNGANVFYQKTNVQLSDADEYSFVARSNVSGKLMFDKSILTVRTDTVAPTLTLYYSSSTASTSLTMVGNNHQYPPWNCVNATCLSSLNWPDLASNELGNRFIQAGPINTFVSSTTDVTISSTTDYSTTITSSVINGFNGKIAPYIKVSGSSKSILRNIFVVQLVKNGGATTTLTRSDGDYYDLDLR